MHVVSGLQEIAIVLTTALAGGLVLERLKQPAILGYILAGILLGPSVLGVVTDLSIVNLLANLGVLMVLFVVGLNLNLRSFKRTILVSVSVASLQIAGGLGIAFLVSCIFGWSTQVTFLFGFISFCIFNF